MPLEWLEMSYTAVTDLTPISGTPITRLELARCSISDLQPLAGMRIYELDISDTEVFDIRPITNSPVSKLHCRGAPIADFTPVQALPIKAIEFSPERASELMRILQEKDPYWINGSADLFWQEHDIAFLARQYDGVAMAVIKEARTTEDEGYHNYEVSYDIESFVLGSVTNPPLSEFTDSVPAAVSVPQVGDRCLVFLNDGRDRHDRPVGIPWSLCKATEERLKALTAQAEQDKSSVRAGARR
jgi:hypothetical protein